MTPFFFSGLDSSKKSRSIDFIHEKLRWSKAGGILIPFDRVISQLFFPNIPPYHVEDSDFHVPWLKVEIPDLFFLLNQKYLAAYKYFLRQTEANYLFTTNVNNFCQTNLLSEIIQTLPTSGVYAGTNLHAGYKNFISGANRILSRDVVELIVNESESIDKGYIEDVALGIFLENKRIHQIELPTLNINSIEELEAISTKKLLNFHQIRVKSLSNRKYCDLQIMKRIVERMYMKY